MIKLHGCCTLHGYYILKVESKYRKKVINRKERKKKNELTKNLETIDFKADEDSSNKLKEKTKIFYQPGVC